MKVKQITEADSMSQLGQVQAMKKAKIVGMTPGQAGQPATYKVSLDGTVDPTQAMNPNAAGITNVTADKITKDPSGNIVINMNPAQQSNGPDTSLVGKDAQVKEEPNEDQVFSTAANNTNTYFVNYDQMAAKVGNKYVKIVPSNMWTDLTPDVVKKAEEQGFSQIYLSVNGKNIPAVMGGDKNLGSKIIVSPRDLKAISASKQGPSTPDQATGEQPPMPMKESPELTAMLRIAGLR